MGFYNQIKQFLNQANTDDLKTKHYDSEYLGLKVRVGFGQGNKAQVPWISFLKEPNKTSNGIYPVYLFYKHENILILAYGISVTKTPNQTWNSENKKTINQYFKENNLKDKVKFGSSYVFKVYKVNNLPSESIIETDLIEIINEYGEINTNNTLPNKRELELDNFKASLEKSGLQYSEKLIVRFVSSLLTKPFVILTGLSGSGKTKLAQAFVQWICADGSQYRIIPVGADWTNREPLLGYPNALKPEEYVKPDNGVLDLIIHANSHHSLPHFLILDEMNLSHVERYFADFLSAMESKEDIPLHAEYVVENGVPSKLHIPNNLFFIGTVNIDETTNMFSPKVLDRANTIEFRVLQEEMSAFLTKMKNINMNELKGKGAAMAESFMELTWRKSYVDKDIEVIKGTLLKFFSELRKTGAEFGYRSASEIFRLIYFLGILNNTLTVHEKVDIAIIQKLLPKLHGSRRKLCPILEILGSFCISGEHIVKKDVFEKEDFDLHDKNVLYPLSLEKIIRMYKGAMDNGFASFAEA